jgi:hypothetical protein
MIVNVYPTVGAYLVAEMSRGTLHAYTVSKDKTCSCGSNNGCRHVEAVADHLKAGGKRAPEKQERALPASSSPAQTMVCHVCGAEVQVDGPYWRCLRDSSHYWQWRGERSGVKDFLTRPHPAKMGAFYEQTDEERESFLAAAARRYNAYLMSLNAQRDRPRFAPDDSARTWF